MNAGEIPKAWENGEKHYTHCDGAEKHLSYLAAVLARLKETRRNNPEARRITESGSGTSD
jgi:hypothetical protein